MRECLGKCCGAKKCDVAYRIDHDCFSVKCFSPELCKVSEAPARNGFVQIATLTPVEKLKLHTGILVCEAFIIQLLNLLMRAHSGTKFG